MIRVFTDNELRIQIQFLKKEHQMINGYFKTINYYVKLLIPIPIYLFLNQFVGIKNYLDALEI